MRVGLKLSRRTGDSAEMFTTKEKKNLTKLLSRAVEPDDAFNIEELHGPGHGMIKKTERNDPCPCGSGKKYKKCCGMNGMSFRKR